MVYDLFLFLFLFFIANSRDYGLWFEVVVDGKTILHFSCLAIEKKKDNYDYTKQ